MMKYNLKNIKKAKKIIIWIITVLMLLTGLVLSIILGFNSIHNEKNDKTEEILLENQTENINKTAPIGIKTANEIKSVEKNLVEGLDFDNEIPMTKTVNIKETKNEDVKENQNKNNLTMNTTQKDMPKVEETETEEYNKESVDESENNSSENESLGNTYSAMITHYCACSRCNGKWSYTENGINYTATASGMTLYDGIDGNYCAATFGKLGDIITINGTDYKIVDRMGGNDGYCVDIFVSDGHNKCNELGRYTSQVILH